MLNLWSSQSLRLNQITLGYQCFMILLWLLTSKLLLYQLILFFFRFLTTIQMLRLTIRQCHSFLAGPLYKKLTICCHCTNQLKPWKYFPYFIILQFSIVQLSHPPIHVFTGEMSHHQFFFILLRVLKFYWLNLLHFSIGI